MVHKERYKNNLLLIRNILNKYDPEYIKPGQVDGAPADEYNLEAQKILSYIFSEKFNKSDKDALKNKINKIWEEFFNRDCSDSSSIAKDILLTIFPE